MKHDTSTWKWLESWALIFTLLKCRKTPHGIGKWGEKARSHSHDSECVLFRQITNGNKWTKNYTTKTQQKQHWNAYFLSILCGTFFPLLSALNASSSQLIHGTTRIIALLCLMYLSRYRVISGDFSRCFMAETLAYIFQAISRFFIVGFLLAQLTDWGKHFPRIFPVNNNL